MSSLGIGLVAAGFCPACGAGAAHGASAARGKQAPRVAGAPAHATELDNAHEPPVNGARCWCEPVAAVVCLGATVGPACQLA